MKDFIIYLFTGRKSVKVVTTDIDPKYFRLHVDIWASTRNYGIVGVAGFLLGLQVLSYIGDQFRNPFTKVVSPTGFIIAFATAIATWMAVGLSVALYTFHLGNQRRGAKYGQFTWRLKAGKYIFNFHGWILDIQKLTGPEVKVTLGEKQGEVIANLAQEFSLNLFMFWLAEQPFQRFVYLTPANAEEELAKFVEGSVVAGTGWKGWWINVQVHPFDQGILTEVRVKDELIPIAFPAGDHYQYMSQLLSARMLHITDKVVESAKVTTLAVMVNQSQLELENKIRVIEAYEKAEHNYEGDVGRGVVRAMDVARRRGKGDTVPSKNLTRKQMTLVLLATIVTVGLLIFFLR